MRNGGDIKKLSEVSDILKSKVPYFEGEKQYFSTKGINNDGDYQSVNVTYNNKPSRAGLFPEINNVGFAKMKGTNKVFIVDNILKDSLFSTGFMILKCKDLIIPKYLFWFLLSENFLKQKDFLSGDGIMGGLKNSSHAEISIRIPELSEQKEIVEILDQAFESIEKAKINIEKNIENAKELFQSKVNQIFSQTGEGWEENKLVEICSVLNGYAFKSTDKINLSNTQVLRMGNLYNNILDLKRKPVFYPEHFAKDYSDFLLKDGDLVMSLTGTVDKEDYGYTVEIQTEGRNLLLNQRIMKIDLKSSDVLNKMYLKYYLLSREFLKRLFSTASGTRQANLSSSKILNLKINYPKSVSKQKEIVETLDIVDNHIQSLLTSYEEELKNLEELKKSILQKAFNGELTNKNKAA